MYRWSVGSAETEYLVMEMQMIVLPCCSSAQMMCVTVL